MNSTRYSTRLIANEFGRHVKNIGQGVLVIPGSDIGCDLTMMEVDGAVVIPTSSLSSEQQVALLHKAAQVAGLCRDGHRLSVRVVIRGEFIHIIHAN